MLTDRPGRRPRERGAASVMVLSAISTLAAGAAAIFDVQSAGSAQAHAQSAAAAVAHGAEVAILADPHRDDLSIAAQSGDQNCDWPPQPRQPDPMQDASCQPILTAVTTVARANGAVVVRYRYAHDLRDQRLEPVAGRLTSLVEVAVPRRLPIGPSCRMAPDGDGAGACWAIAWSAAEQTDAPAP